MLVSCGEKGGGGKGGGGGGEGGGGGGGGALLADLPGLVEGAHAGRGLGRQFLQQLRRVKVVLFVLDTTCAEVGSRAPSCGEMARDDPRWAEIRSTSASSTPSCGESCNSTTRTTSHGARHFFTAVSQTLARRLSDAS